MDRLSLRNRVRRQSLITTEELTDAEINQDLEQGILDTATLYAWPWMRTVGTIVLADGTAEYNLPADLMYLQNLIHDGVGASSLVRTTLEAVKATYGDSVGDSDLPHLWYQSSDTTIVFVPTPDAVKTVNVHYYAVPDIANDFNDDTSVPPWHPAFHRLLVDFALAQIWESEDQEQRSQYYWEKYGQQVERMAAFYSQALPPSPLVVGQGLNRRSLRRPFAAWPEV